MTRIQDTPKVSRINPKNKWEFSFKKQTNLRPWQAEGNKQRKPDKSMVTQAYEKMRNFDPKELTPQFVFSKSTISDERYKKVSMSNDGDSEKQKPNQKDG
jgi:hypothetical protein